MYMHLLRVTVLSVVLLAFTADSLCCHDENGRTCHSLCRGLCFTSGAKINGTDIIQWRQFCGPAPSPNESVCNDTCTDWKSMDMGNMWVERDCCCSAGNKCNAAPFGDDGYMNNKTRPSTTDDLTTVKAPNAPPQVAKKGGAGAKEEHMDIDDEDGGTDYSVLYAVVPIVCLGLILLGVIAMMVYKKNSDESLSYSWSTESQPSGLNAPSSARVPGAVPQPTPYVVPPH